jgi:putative phosphoesterase
MKIGVISDTHINNPHKLLPNEVFQAFQGVDFILHAGDILIEEVLIQLEAIAPVYAVAGNNDGHPLYQKLGMRRLITAGSKRIGLTHGDGRTRTYMNAYGEFMEDNVDCIVYGHSHIPHNEVINGILFFNPGSATQRRFQPKHSLGILYVNHKITGEIIYID